MDLLAQHGSVARLRPPVVARRRRTDVRPVAAPDEATLVRRSAAGDAASWELLVGRHAAATWRWAASACVDEQQALQVCGVVWLRLAEAVGGLGSRPVGPWLRAGVEQEASRLRQLQRRARVLERAPG